MTYIAYYRVSTVRQGESGLGLEAQKDGMVRHMRAEPSMEFTDIQSGKRSKLSKRSEIYAALQAGKKHGLPVVVYKLDRLGRDVAFLQECLNSGVHLIACDFPATNADAATNRLVLNVMMSVAEYELSRISSRTKDAVAMRKKRGDKLGRNHNFKKSEYMAGGIETARKHWTDEKASVYKVASQLSKEGAELKTIALRLKEMGFSKYSRTTQVRRLLHSGTIVAKAVA